MCRNVRLQAKAGTGNIGIHTRQTLNASVPCPIGTGVSRVISWSGERFSCKETGDLLSRQPDSRLKIASSGIRSGWRFLQQSFGGDDFPERTQFLEGAARLLDTPAGIFLPAKAEVVLRPGPQRSRPFHFGFDLMEDVEALLKARFRFCSSCLSITRVWGGG